LKPLTEGHINLKFSLLSEPKSGISIYTVLLNCSLVFPAESNVGCIYTGSFYSVTTTLSAESAFIEEQVIAQPITLPPMMILSRSYFV
jgi:hypothetical protein